MTGHKRPFRRNVRQFIDGSYYIGERGDYIKHSKFARNPENFVRAFLILQKDLIDLFDYVEPSDVNKDCYSFRLHAMLMRTCIEVEANCKAILVENGYNKAPKDLNVKDYEKIDASHHLSSYTIKLPYWHGHNNIRAPFSSWSGGESLKWYQAYNKSKHDRHNNFQLATFENVVNAVCGLVALLSSQFYMEDFSPTGDLLSTGGPSDGYEPAIGNYFRVRFPDNWAADELYIFTDADWVDMKKDPDPFLNLF